jgi:hypothetical protein
MMRIVISLLMGTLLAACSGSNRVEDILPAWANTPQSPATQYVAHKKHVEARSKPDATMQEAARPQEVEKSVVRSLHEE